MVLVGNIIIVGGDIAAVGDIISRAELALVDLIGDGNTAVIAAVNIDAVHEVYGIDVTGIIAVNVPRITVVPDGIQLCSVGIIRLGRISGPAGSALGEAHEIDVVLSLGKEGVLRIYALILNKAFPVVGPRRRFSGKRLDIVVDGLRGAVRDIQMEGHVRAGHDVDINQHIGVGRAALGSPAFAVIIGRAVVADDGEVGRDVLLIESLDLFDGGPTGALGIAGAVIPLSVIPIVIISVTR